MALRVDLTFTEDIFAKQDHEGVKVRVENGVVTEVYLTWLVKSAGSSGWDAFPLQEREDQLRRMAQAIDEALDQIARAKQRYIWRDLLGGEGKAE